MCVRQSEVALTPQLLIVCCDLYSNDLSTTLIGCVACFSCVALEGCLVIELGSSWLRGANVGLVTALMPLPAVDRLDTAVTRAGL